MLAGCMDIVWSMAGVITAPWSKKIKDKEEEDEMMKAVQIPFQKKMWALCDLSLCRITMWILKVHFFILTILASHAVHEQIT